MLGLSSISELPISSSIFDPNVSINVTGNPLTLSIGSATSLAGAFLLTYQEIPLTEAVQVI